MKRPLLPLAALVLATGCAHSRPPQTAFAMAGNSALEADLAFARLALEQPPAAAFARFTDGRSIELPPAGPPVVGQSAITANLEGLPAGALQWSPQGGETSLSGELAWTWGNYTLRSPNGETAGKYVSIWHRRPDGSWLLAADIGNQVPPRK